MCWVVPSMVVVKTSATSRHGTRTRTAGLVRGLVRPAAGLLFRPVGVLDDVHEVGTLKAGYEPL
jgi:hypothetical protein